jgi:hypothetical protein
LQIAGQPAICMVFLLVLVFRLVVVFLFFVVRIHPDELAVFGTLISPGGLTSNYTFLRG